MGLDSGGRITVPTRPPDCCVRISEMRGSHGCRGDLGDKVLTVAAFGPVVFTSGGVDHPDDAIAITITRIVSRMIR